MKYTFMKRAKSTEPGSELNVLKAGCLVHLWWNTFGATEAYACMGYWTNGQGVIKPDVDPGRRLHKVNRSAGYM